MKKVKIIKKFDFIQVIIVIFLVKNDKTEENDTNSASNETGNYKNY